VVATKLSPVEAKETRNSFMYGTRHLQPALGSQVVGPAHIKNQSRD
jgi:hypothetical protein